MATNTNDILGYLQVLNYGPVLQRLTPSEITIGRQHLMGCYCRLMESLEKEVLDGSSRTMYVAIQKREHLNAHMLLPNDDPRLLAATGEVANMLLEYIREGAVLKTVQTRFLNELEAELNRILERYNASVGT